MGAQSLEPKGSIDLNKVEELLIPESIEKLEVHDMPVVAPKLTEPGDSPVNKELLENPKPAVRKKRRGKAKWKKSEPPYRIYKLVDRHVDEKGRVHYRANFINYDASHDVVL